MREFPTRAHVSRPRLDEARRLLTSRARLFSLLALLIPLFGALQALAADNLPRVAVRGASSETPVVAIERIVERLVYVPVPSVMLHPWPRLTWDLSRWDMSRLPSVDSYRLPLFRPAPTVSAWPASVQAADAAQVNDAGLIGTGFSRAVRLFEDPAIGEVDGSLILADPIAGRLRLPASLVAQPLTPGGPGSVLSPSRAPDSLLTNTTGPNIAFVDEPRAGETGTDSLPLGGDGLDTELSASAPLAGLPLPPAAPISAAPAASTPVSATSTPRPGSTATPTAIPATATARAVVSATPTVATATPVPPVLTSAPTTTAVPPTATDEIPATATLVPPTSTFQPPSTKLPATATARPPATSTPRPPATATHAPATSIPTAEPTNGPADATDTPVPTRTPTPRTQATQTPTPQTQPTSTPRADPTKTPTPKAESTKAEATKTPTPQPAPTKTPTPEPQPTKTPTPKSEPTKTPTPKAEPTNTPTPKPAPTNTPTPKAEPTKTPTPKPQPSKTPPPHGGGNR